MVERNQGANFLVSIEFIKKLEDLKIELLCEFDEINLTEEMQQYILSAFSHVDLAIRNLNILKLKIQ